MGSALEYLLGMVVGLPVVGALLFFTAFPGAQFIRVHAHMRALRKELEPVARAVGAITSTRWVTEREQVMYYFSFPNEKWAIGGLTVDAWLTLEVSADGFNVYVPSFSPPKQYSDDYQALERAVHRLRNRGT